MRILKPPYQIQRLGWPKIMILDRDEKVPALGMPYIRANNTESDNILLFRLLIPYLYDHFPQFNWKEVYAERTGHKYKMLPIYKPWENTEHVLGDADTSHREEEITLEQMAQDSVSHVDLEVLMELRMIPSFCEDLAQAITVNVTNNYLWQDGYNKKTGVCSGFMQEQPRGKTLLIMDVSKSIPEGASAGLIQLLSTMTDITNADLIITGGRSEWFSNSDARKLDPHWIRRSFLRSNEYREFTNIINEHGHKYDTVIAFGDSDDPGISHLVNPIKVKNFYSYFTGERDRYGTSYDYCAGYGKWCLIDNEDCVVHHNTDWIKFFRW